MRVGIKSHKMAAAEGFLVGITGTCLLKEALGRCV